VRRYPAKLTTVLNGTRRDRGNWAKPLNGIKINQLWSLMVIAMHFVLTSQMRYQTMIATTTTTTDVVKEVILKAVAGVEAEADMDGAEIFNPPADKLNHDLPQPTKQIRGPPSRLQYKPRKEINYEVFLRCR
jgi:hypothetical protein